MKPGNEFELYWRKILKKEALADLSQYHRPAFCDEVPLYSRTADIAFLSHLPRAKQDAELLRFALDFLHSIIEYKKHRKPFFAAITIWNFPEDDPIVPYLFARCDDFPGIRGITVKRVATPFGKMIREMVAATAPDANMDVLEDTATVPEIPRVFIGPSKPPYPSFKLIRSFGSGKMDERPHTRHGAKPRKGPAKRRATSPAARARAADR